jgi:ALG3 protein
MGACLLLMKRQWTLGGILYAFALGIKMNALLYLPGIMTVITLAAGLEKTFRVVTLIVEVQVHLLWLLNGSKW